MARILVSMAAAAVLALGVATPSHADESVAKDVTLEGPVDGGGTVSITLTEDRSAVTRVELAGVTMECNVNPGVVHFSPPIPVAGGAFQTQVITNVDVTAVSIAGFGLSGTVVSRDEASGTVRSGAALLSGPICTGPAHSWTAATQVDTPPGSDDLRFAGTVEGGGTIALTTAADGRLTSLAVADVPLADGCLGPNPLTVRAFLEPPANGTASVPVWVSVSLDTGQMFAAGAPEISYAASGGDALAGTLSFCFTEVAFTAQLVPAATPTAMPGAPGTATPTPPVAVGSVAGLPDAAAAPRALPATGGERSGGPQTWLVIAGLSVAGALVAGGLVRLRGAAR